MKDLVQAYLPDYTEQLGLTEFAPLVPLNIDLSTISAATDVALGRGDPPDRVVDLNFQSGPDEDRAARVLMYHAILHHRCRVPVHSILVLLRPVADHVHLTGKLRYEGRRRKGRMDFTYEVVRLWQQPIRRYLKGGLGTLPLAPLCRLPAGVPAAEAVGPVIQRIDERLDREAGPEDRKKLLAATYVLLGLRLPHEVLDPLFEGVRAMKEASTYQKILADGRIEGELKALRNTLLRQGRYKFGPAGETIQTRIAAFTDPERLERMTERLLVVGSWQELLDTP